MTTAAQETLFEEEQAFRQPWLWLLLGAVFLLETAVISLAAVKGPVSAPHIIVGAAVGIGVPVLVGLLMFFLKLTVRVDPGYVHVRFFPLLRKDIPLETIVRWEARTYRPILEYGGWGIRWSPTGKGMAYNVRGNRGVQLEFTNGRRLLIGSQRPEELARAISEAKERKQ